VRLLQPQGRRVLQVRSGSSVGKGRSKNESTKGKREKHVAGGNWQFYKIGFLPFAAYKRLPRLPFALYALPFYFVLALIFTNPLLVSLGTAVNDPVDPMLNTWILAWNHHALLTNPAELLNANIFYPYAHTLLYSETLLLPSLILFPLAAAVDNPLLTYNLLVLLGFTSTGMSGYLLGSWLLRNRWAGVVVGIVLAFNSYTLTVLPKAQLLQFTWLPLALLYTGKILARPQHRSALLLALFLAAQFYTVVYYGLFGFLAVGLAGAVGWLLYPFDSRAKRWRSLILLAVSGSVALLLCLPLAIPYVQLSQRQGLVRTLADAWPFAASLEMWRTPPPNSLLYGWLHSGDLPRVGFYPVESLFPGAILLLIALAGMILWGKRGCADAMMRGSADAKRRRGEEAKRRGGEEAEIPPSIGEPGGRGGREDRSHLSRNTHHATRNTHHASRNTHHATRITHHASRFTLYALLLGIAFFFVLSLGPYLQVTSLQPDFSQVLPYAWLHEWLPGFTALRAPARFAIFVFLGLGIAAGYLFTRIRRQGLQAALVVLLLVESFSWPASGLYAPTLAADRRSFYEFLAAQPETIYLELPVYSPVFDPKVEHWLEGQYESLFHWQRTPTGYSGFMPPRHADLLLFVSLFPQAEAAHFLQALGVEWVFWQRDRLPAEQWQAIEATADAQGWPLRQWGEVWAVQLPGATAGSPDLGFFIPERAGAGGELTLSAIFTAAEPTAILPNSPLGAFQMEWWRGGQRLLVQRIDQQPPFYVDRVAVSPVPAPVPDDPGLYELRIYHPHSETLVTAGFVEVTAAETSPEVTLLAVKPIGVEIVCETEGGRLHIDLRTIGWYDTPFTLSARLLDPQGVEVDRSAVDVEFPPFRPRSNLLTTFTYSLPLQQFPLTIDGPLTAEISAYQWQQQQGNVAQRWFVDADGAILPVLQLPVTSVTGC
jgi:hypothetical protein